MICSAECQRCLHFQAGLDHAFKHLFTDPCIQQTIKKASRCQCPQSVIQSQAHRAGCRISSFLMGPWCKSLEDAAALLGMLCSAVLGSDFIVMVWVQAAGKLGCQILRPCLQLSHQVQGHAAGCRQTLCLMVTVLVHLQAAGKAGPPSMEANVMCMAAPAPRFAYLPISTPSLPQSSLRRLALGQAAPSQSSPAASLSSADAEAGDYSFAGLESARVGSKGVIPSQRSVDLATGSTMEVSSLASPHMLAMRKPTCTVLMTPKAFRLLFFSEVSQGPPR